MAETIKIVEQLISEIDRTIEIDSIVDNLDGTCTIFTCDTKWVQSKEDFSVTIDGNDFPVVSIVANESITIEGACPVVDSFEVYPPFFFHGTVSDTNSQLNNISNDDADKTPMSYLYEPFVENMQDQESSLEMISPIRIFFLSYADMKSWFTPEHYNETIIPMKNLARGFEQAIHDSELIDTLGEYSRISRVKFGVPRNRSQKDSKGYEKARFDMELSGVEILLSLPIKKNRANCDC